MEGFSFEKKLELVRAGLRRPEEYQFVVDVAGVVYSTRERWLEAREVEDLVQFRKEVEDPI